jgi:hypothetical protein
MRDPIGLMRTPRWPEVATRAVLGVGRYSGGRLMVMAA